MNISNQIKIRSEYEPLFERAANIAHWPDILSHYRWVKILDQTQGRITAEMAARHKGFPLWWKTILIPLPLEKRLVFKHIGGVTRGMDVQWTFEQTGTAAGIPVWLVQIHHQFDPPWPFPGPWIAKHMIGDLVVKQVANKTLRRMKELAES